MSWITQTTHNFVSPPSLVFLSNYSDHLNVCVILPSITWFHWLAVSALGSRGQCCATYRAERLGGGGDVHLSVLSLAVIAPFELPAFVGSQRFLLIRATLSGRQLGWGRKGQVLPLSVHPRSPNVVPSDVGSSVQDKLGPCHRNSQRSIFNFYHQTLNLELKALAMWIRVACGVKTDTCPHHLNQRAQHYYVTSKPRKSRETPPHRWENILTSVAQFLCFLFLSCSPKSRVLSKCKIPLGSKSGLE